MIHILCHYADLMPAIALALIRDALKLLDCFQGSFQRTNVRLKAAGAPDRPGIGQRRTACYYLERITGRGCSDTDETMFGDSENHVAVQPAKSWYATMMVSRLQCDRTSGATDLTPCAPT